MKTYELAKQLESGELGFERILHDFTSCTDLKSIKPVNLRGRFCVLVESTIPDLCLTSYRIPLEQGEVEVRLVGSQGVLRKPDYRPPRYCAVDV